MKKYHRTMQDAFGPYTDNRLEPLPETPDNKDFLVGICSLFVGIVFLGLIFWSVI